MTIDETITWHRNSEPPYSDVAVLIYCPGTDEPVCMGFHKGGEWRGIDGSICAPGYVQAWAHLPAGCKP